MPRSLGDDEHLRRVLADLEQQADGLDLAERDALLGEHRRGEYARVSLEDRLHAAVGATVRVEVLGVGAVEGRVERAGAGWLALGAPTGGWLLRTAALAAVRGLPDRALPADARSVAARLGPASPLRALAASRTPVQVHRLDGSVVPGLIGRVGADFVEVHPVHDATEEPGGAAVALLPLAALAGIRC